MKIGIDAIEIARFTTWRTFKKSKLQRIFTDQEIAYCLSEPIKAAERFAVRFAAKEAFYKAISSLSKRQLPFLYICKHSELVKDSKGAVSLKVNWRQLDLAETFTAELSLTHTQITAIAVILIVPHTL